MKAYNLNKAELVEYCESIGIDTKGKTKVLLVEEAEIFGTQEIEKSKKDGTDYDLLYSKIEALSNLYAETLKDKIEVRKEEMLEDDNSHYLIYRVLGISKKDGQLIDEYQNTGRFFI